VVVGQLWSERVSAVVGVVVGQCGSEWVSAVVGVVVGHRAADIRRRSARHPRAQRTRDR